MTADATTLQRRFSVHGIAEAPSHGHLVEAVSFEDAAFHYLEDSHPAADHDEVRLFVEDCETGERHCFRIDLETGDSAPCE